MLPANIKLVTQRDFCVLNTRPGNHYPVNFSGGEEVVTTGKDGICILPDGNLVPGIEVSFSNLNPPEATIPLTVVKVVKK